MAQIAQPVPGYVDPTKSKGFKLPSFDGINFEMPQIDMPDLPACDMPEFDIPSVSLPSFDWPKFSLPKRQISAPVLVAEAPAETTPKHTVFRDTAPVKTVQDLGRAAKIATAEKVAEAAPKLE